MPWDFAAKSDRIGRSPFHVHFFHAAIGVQPRLACRQALHELADRNPLVRARALRRWTARLVHALCELRVREHLSNWIVGWASKVSQTVSHTQDEQDACVDRH